MRISKKFSGYNIGKHTFIRKSTGTRSPVSVSSVSCFSESAEPVAKLRRSSSSIYFSDDFYYPVFDATCIQFDHNFLSEFSPRLSSSSPVESEITVEAEEWKSVLQYLSGDTFIGSDLSCANTKTEINSGDFMLHFPQSACWDEYGGGGDFENVEIESCEDGYESTETCYDDEEIAFCISNL
jgi:hypothetical protein